MVDLTGWAYVDNDVVLAEVTGHPLSEAAEVLGWDGLHDAEVTCLEVILDRPGPFVAGAAASVVERVDGRALLREAYVVYLRATRRDAWSDGSGSGAGRPWLDGDPAEFFRQQYAQRGAWFESVGRPDRRRGLAETYALSPSPSWTQPVRRSGQPAVRSA